MALAPLQGTSLYIKVSDGADPEVFAHPCLINTRRGIQFRSSSGKVIVPDCDNPNDPAWEQVFTDSLGVTISGAGTLDNLIATIQFYDTWFRDGAPKNVQAWLGTVGKWAGAFKLTGWEVTGDRGANAQVTVTLESHGVVAAFAAGS